MSQIEIAAKEADFHFNKHHLKDPTVPMWIIRAKGQTYQVAHVNSTIPWSTKESIDNPHTKGAIKFKNCLITIDDDNVATITELTPEDKARLIKREAVRIITRFGSKLREALISKNIKHSNIQTFGGGCSTTWFVCDIFDPRQYTILALMIPEIRQLMPNEEYSKWYDQRDEDDDLDIEDAEDWFDNNGDDYY